MLGRARGLNQNFGSSGTQKYDRFGNLESFVIYVNM